MKTAERKRHTHSGRTRLLCEYPAWPGYHGGEVNVATSFACATE